MGIRWGVSFGDHWSLAPFSLSHLVDSGGLGLLTVVQAANAALPSGALSESEQQRVIERAGGALRVVAVRRQ